MPPPKIKTNTHFYVEVKPVCDKAGLVVVPSPLMRVDGGPEYALLNASSGVFIVFAGIDGCQHAFAVHANGSGRYLYDSQQGLRAVTFEPGDGETKDTARECFCRIWAAKEVRVGQILEVTRN